MNMKQLMLAGLISGLSVFGMNAMEAGRGFEYDTLSGGLAVSHWIRETFFAELSHVDAWGTEEEKEALKVGYTKQEDDKEIAPLLIALKDVLYQAVQSRADWKEKATARGDTSRDRGKTIKRQSLRISEQNRKIRLQEARIAELEAIVAKAPPPTKVEVVFLTLQLFVIACWVPR